MTATEKLTDKKKILEKLIKSKDFKDKFIITFNHKNKKTGKYDQTEFILYKGLQYLATEMGLKSIKVDVLFQPTAENKFNAICQATAIGEDGNEYTDIGDANVGNCGLVKDHFIRMASTRAKARSLREFTGAQWTAYDEINPNDFKDKPDDKNPEDEPQDQGKNKDEKPNNNGNDVPPAIKERMLKAKGEIGVFAKQLITDKYMKSMDDVKSFVTQLGHDENRLDGLLMIRDNLKRVLKEYESGEREVA